MKKFITEISLKERTALIRLDLNVPLSSRGRITSKKRIEEALPTIRYVLDQGAKAVLFSHLGRVKSDKDLATKSLVPVAKVLAELLQMSVNFVATTRGEELEEAIENLKFGEVLLVENTRFEDLNDNAESANNLELAEYWASLGDVFINDAFGMSHREHASNVGIATFSRESAVGFLVKKEIENLSRLLDKPKRPFIAIIGGAKVSDKIDILEILVENADRLIIGGAMAYTFLAAQGIGIGNSLVEEDKIGFAREFLKRYASKIVLPIDHSLTKSFSNEEPTYNNDNPLEVPQTFMALDIGPQTRKLIDMHLRGAKKLGFGAAQTVFWNGPLGVTEFTNFALGTNSVVESIASLPNAFTVVGGGDSVAAIEAADASHNFSHVSTGGGAALMFIQEKTLPGLEAIQDEGVSYDQLSPFKNTQSAQVSHAETLESFLENQARQDDSLHADQELSAILKDQKEDKPLEATAQQKLQTKEQSILENENLNVPLDHFEATQSQILDKPNTLETEALSTQENFDISAEELAKTQNIISPENASQEFVTTSQHDENRLLEELEAHKNQETHQQQLQKTKISNLSSKNTVELEEQLLQDLDKQKTQTMPQEMAHLLDNLEQSREAILEPTAEAVNSLSEEDLYTQNTLEGLQTSSETESFSESNFSSDTNFEENLATTETSLETDIENSHFDDLDAEASDDSKLLEAEDDLFSLPEDELSEEIVDNEEEAPKKRGFFARLFGRK